MLYTIGEMAKRLGVAPSTLRYYDKEGLLPFVERSQGGIRMFREEDFEWLLLISCLKETGMPIHQIKVFMDLSLQGDKTIAERLEMIDRQREAVKTQIANLQANLEMLDYKHWYYETAKAAGTCEIHKGPDPLQAPARFKALLARHLARLQPANQESTSESAS